MLKLEFCPCMKKNILTLCITIAIMAACACPTLAEKQRLPQSVNSYQPAIVPVLSIDGKVLYFDRKWSIENVGGTKDEDDIWYSIRSFDSIWSYPYRMAPGDNTRFSDVVFSLSPDMSHALIYGIYDSVTNRKIDGYSIAEIQNFKFQNAVPLLIESYRNYSNSFYATLSPDMRTLILCFKGDSTLGGHDLYFSQLDESKGIWSAPKNLGSRINSPQAEGSPYIAPDGRTLYFSSERPGGSGKFDLYMSRRTDDTWLNWTEPVSFGPINSIENDNGICLFPLGDTAIINSYDTTEKRSGFYRVALPAELQPLPYVVLRGSIEADSAGAPTELRSKVEFTASYKQKRGFDRFLSSSGNKEFYFVLPAGETAHIRALVPGFDPKEFSINTEGIARTQYIDYKLKLSRTISKSAIAATVYFDFASSEISAATAAALTEGMKKADCIECKITVRGYADSSGTDEFNEKLSEERARKVSRYIQKILPLAKIEVLWYGKRIQTEGDDEKNRRVEVIISKPE